MKYNKKQRNKERKLHRGRAQCQYTFDNCALLMKSQCSHKFLFPSQTDNSLFCQKWDEGTRNESTSEVTSLPLQASKAAYIAFITISYNCALRTHCLIDWAWSYITRPQLEVAQYSWYYYVHTGLVASLLVYTTMYSFYLWWHTEQPSLILILTEIAPNFWAFLHS